MVRGVARARWEGMGEREELKFDGKMRIVMYMIYKVAYIIEFWKGRPWKKAFYFKYEETEIYFWKF